MSLPTLPISSKNRPSRAHPGRSGAWLLISGDSVISKNRCAHPGACGHLFILTRGLIGLQRRLRKNFAMAWLDANAKRRPLSPSACWPTPPKSAKKGRKSGKALGQQPMAKRPLARRNQQKDLRVRRRRRTFANCQANWKSVYFRCPPNN